MTKKTTKIICGIAVLTFVILKFLGLELWDALSYGISVATLVEYTYDRYLWRYNPLDKTPRLFGTYDTLFISNYNGRTLQHSEIVIKQTLSSISISEKSQNGCSIAIAAELLSGSHHGDPWRLCYTYKTHPYDMTGQDDQHHGTAIMNINCNDEIIGTYYTNRIVPTKGTLIMVRRFIPSTPVPIDPNNYLK